MKKIFKRIGALLTGAAMLACSLYVTPAITAHAEATTPESGNIYYIKNKNSGLYLTVENDSASDGANVIQSTGTGSLGQRWILEQNSSTGYYRLHPATDMTGGISLDVANGSSDNNTNIQIYTNNGYSAQNFDIIAADSNSGYYIATQVTDFASCLDVASASTSSGANVLQYTYKGSDNQIWYFEQASWPSSSSSSSTTTTTTSSSSTDYLIEDGWYYLKNVNSQLYMEVEDDNDVNFGNVAQGTGTGDKRQRWYVTNQGSNYITLQNGMSGGRMLDVYYGGSSDGTNIDICGVSHVPS